MKRKLFILTIATISTISLFGCGTKTVKTTENITTTIAETTEEATTATPAETTEAETPEATTVSEDQDTTTPTTPSQQETTATATVYKEHIIEKGENLHSISKQYYGDYSKVDEIMKLNDIVDMDAIYTGQKIKLP